MLNENWVTGIVCLLFVILATTIHNSYYFILARLKEVFSNDRQFSNVPAHAAVGEIRHTLMLNIVSSVSLSLMLADQFEQLSEVSHWHIPSPWTTPLLFAAILAFIYLKTAVYALVSSVFYSSEKSRRWVSTHLFLTSLMGFLIFPISAVDIFSGLSFKIVAWCLLFLLISYEIIVFFRLIAHFQAPKYGHVLIFSYFCSVEVAPLLVIAHFCELF